MDLCSHSGKFCSGATRHSGIPAAESVLDCRLLARRLITTSPIRRTTGGKADTPMLKRRLNRRKLSGVDKENLNVVQRPGQRLPTVGRTARLALFPCVTARSNSSSQQLLETNPGGRIGGFDKCHSPPFPEIGAVKVSVGSPEVSSGSTSVWSVEHHDFSEIQVLREAQNFDRDVSSVKFLPPNSPLRSSSPLCRERCAGAPLGRTSTQRTRIFASTAEIEHVCTGSSLRDLSSITQASTSALHEQISGSSLAGAFCSTFSYPLHSTIIEQCNSISPISTVNSDLQDASSDPDQITDETLVKSSRRLLGEPQPKCTGLNRELTSIYLSSRNKTVLEDSNACHIPLYNPSQPPIPVVQSSQCKFNCSRMFASQYEGARNSTNNITSSGFAENTAVFSVSSPLSTSNGPRTKLHRKLKRQIGRSRLDVLVHQQTIPQSRSTIENKNESFSLLARRSSTPDIMELSDGGQSGSPQLDPSSVQQNPTILDMAVKMPTISSPSASSNPNNDTTKQQIPFVNMSETNRNIPGPLKSHKRIQCKNCLNISTCEYYKTMVPCCAEHSREPYSHVNRTRIRKSFRHREAFDNIDPLCCCRGNGKTTHRKRQSVEVWGTSHTGQYSTQQQIQYLQRKKVLMRKLRHFRRTFYTDAESNCQFKTFAQI